MFAQIKDSFDSFFLGYPVKEKNRILALKTTAITGIQQGIDQFLTENLYCINYDKRLTLTDALKRAKEDDSTMLQFEAPLLTFPRSTPARWNGDIDHVDTITGTYYLVDNLQSIRSYRGAPKFIDVLRSTLKSNFNITMRVDANMTPSSRIILVFRYA